MTSSRNGTRGSAPWQYASLIAYVAMVAMNALANTLPLFGRSTAEISDSYPTLFTPAGFTFSVWGVIYLLLGAFAVYQVLPARRDDRRLVAFRPWFVASSVLNIGWLMSWHADLIPLSEVIMAGLLLSLIGGYRAIDAWRAPASRTERWLLDTPLSVYLGWISVATIANTAILLVSQGFDGGGSAVTLTVVVLAVAVGLGLVTALRRRDAPYALVVAWGLTGVAAARSGEVQTVFIVAAAGAAVLALVGIWTLATRGAGRGAASPSTT